MVLKTYLMEEASKIPSGVVKSGKVSFRRWSHSCGCRAEPRREEAGGGTREEGDAGG